MGPLSALLPAGSSPLAATTLLTCRLELAGFIFVCLCIKQLYWLSLRGGEVGRIFHNRSGKGKWERGKIDTRSKLVSHFFYWLIITKQGVNAASEI